MNTDEQFRADAKRFANGVDTDDLTKAMIEEAYFAGEIHMLNMIRLKKGAFK